MPTLLFKLSGVPDEEADDIRGLLHDNEVEFYETSSGKWGVSLAAIWLRTEEKLAFARELISVYQNERFEQARDEHEELLRSGQRQTMMGLFKKEPAKFITHIIIVACLIYISTMPFIDIY